MVWGKQYNSKFDPFSSRRKNCLPDWAERCGKKHHLKKYNGYGKNDRWKYPF